MYFQEPTPDTSGYMIAGYAIAFIVMGIYVFSLYLRRRNLNQDMAMLEEMENSTSSIEVSPAAQPSKNTATAADRKPPKL